MTDNITYTLSKTLPQLLLPLGIATVLIVAGLLFRQRWPSFSVWLLRISLLTLVVFSLPLTSFSLIAKLEGHYPAIHPADAPTADAIVILAGGLQPAYHPRPYSQLGPGADRLLMAHKLFNTKKAPLIVVVAGSGDPNLPTEAQETKRILESWGIPSNAILLENKSVNTEQNAERAKILLAEHQISNVLLVTSATHMLRSMALFRAQGISASPMPADHWVTDNPTFAFADWIPNAINLSGSSKVLREYMGLAYYWLIGRVSYNDVFPGESMPLPTASAYQD